jgi:hypothetical protein
MRRVAPRLGIIVSVGPRVGAAIPVGPIGIPLLGVSGDVGFVLRPADKAFEGGARTGFFGKPGWGILAMGRGKNYSHRPELRGPEWFIGPIRRGDPVTGDAVELNPVPGASLLLSREGGFGVQFEWVKLPHLPYPWVRGAFTLYLEHPWLKPLSKPALDGVDWVGRRLRPWIDRFRRRPPKDS